MSKPAKAFFSGKGMSDMVRHANSIIFSILLILLLPVGVPAAGAEALASQSQWVNDYAVVWDSPSLDSKGSMPLGNGDIGLNVWVEKGGDLWFYISKSDSWGDWAEGYNGLLKVGRVRVKLNPNPFLEGQPFSQKLNLAKGQIEITAGQPGSQISLVLWVDANRPVVHLEGKAESPFAMEAAFESTRPEKTGGYDRDRIIRGLKNEVAWCYQSRNVVKLPDLKDHIFGALMRGGNLVNQGDQLLVSKEPAKDCRLSLHALTRHPLTPEQWLEAIHAQADATDRVADSTARQQHEQWWRDFWDRSWMRVSGNEQAREVTQGYILQRFKNACAGRGQWPIHFNGSIFTVDTQVPKVNATTKKSELQPVNGDWRAWGCRFWWQNTRHMYWPMLQSGDFDLMQPLFAFYRRVYEINRRQVKERHGFEGVYFSETTGMEGGLFKAKLTPELKADFCSHHINSILEFSAMAMDYFHATGDPAFARETLIPVADGALTFFANYFPRDEKGRLLLDPDNALETYWKARNPTPDIAGLRWVAARLLELPSGLATPEMRKRWDELSRILPPIPLGQRDGKDTILPCEKFNEAIVGAFKGGYLYMHNMENPELYAVFPFRHYGLGKPDLERAHATYHTRRVPYVGCWHQDPIFAASLGLSSDAREGVAKIFNPVQKSPKFGFPKPVQDAWGDNGMRFPGFWGPGCDYPPDEDHGGVGMNALQLMLMQCEGQKILLMPAWPREWNCQFKLHAPENTTVEGRVVDGKVADLKVTPEARAKDVEICPPSTESGQ